MPAEGEGVGDQADLVGGAQPGHGARGGLVGVERLLVVGPSLLVELVTTDPRVEPAQLVAERGDVLVGDSAHRLEVGELGASVESPLLGAPAQHGGPTRGDQGQEDLHGDHPVRRSRRSV